MAGGNTTTTTTTTVLSLKHTPTWALATVCFIIISISILLEHSIHLLTNWLTQRRKTALRDAVDRLKSELMQIGFLSLLLAVTQKSISKICISPKIANIMLPCSKEPDESAATDSCSDKGKLPLVTQEGLQQLQLLIFVLAIMQIVYSILTVALGKAKMKRWKAWEKETQTTEYQVANDPNRFRFIRQTTFGRRHETCTETSALLWIKCFFRQFFHSVAKVDYLTLRHGFIAAHLSTRNNNFNFQKYINRTLEEDFKVVVSMSPLMWFVIVIFMLVDVHGWNVYLWVSYVPLLIVLVLGTKLEVIVATMALQLKNQNSVIVGTPLVRPNDDLFWFRRPRFVLNLLHLTLFVNAFELAFFIWVTIEFGWDSCYHEHTGIIVTRIVLAVTVQVLCSYITLPLYALVTQMGSQFKSKVLEEQMTKIIKQWHADVREKRKKQEPSVQLPRHPPTSMPSNNNNQLSNQGEIIEEQEEGQM